MTSSFYTELYPDSIDDDAVDEGYEPPNIDNSFIIEMKLKTLDSQAWRAIKIVDDFEDDSAKSVGGIIMLYT